MNDFLTPERLKSIRTPAYLYDLTEVSARYRSLAAALPGYGIRYAVKANPHEAILTRLAAEGALIDASSIGEVRRALAVGVPAARISFTGPAKRRAEVEEAVARGIGHLVVESLHQARMASEAAVAQGRVQTLLARISPATSPKGFGARMTGQATQFGIDEEVAEETIAAIRTLPGVHLAGLHFFAGSNALDAPSIGANFAGCVALALRLAPARMEWQRLIFGSGFGVPYHEGQVALDLPGVAAMIRLALSPLSGIAVDIEIGRWLVAPAGRLLTEVVARKEGRGATIVLTDGGFNTHMAAAGLMGSVVKRNWPMVNLTSDAPSEVVTVAGPLCTSIDLLARDIRLSGVRLGDVLAVGLSGAYGASASPGGFISHPAVREYVWDGTTLSDASPDPTAIARLIGGAFP